MTMNKTVTDTSTAQEGPTYRDNVYYKDDESIYTMNSLGGGSYYRYSSSSYSNISHHITNSQVVDATDI